MDQNLVARGLAVIAYIGLWMFSLAFLVLLIVEAARDTGSCSDIAKYNGTADAGISVFDDDERDVVLPEAGLLLAFVGDQGVRGRAKDVLRMIRQENTSMVFHLGDFDYLESPNRWIQHIFGSLGSTSDPSRLVLDYFAVMGNHDVGTLALAARYSRRIKALLHPEAAGCCCEGQVGIKATCTYRGVAFLQIGHGIACSETNGAQWVQSELERLGPRYPWKFCLFHVVQHKMQVESKGDEQGFGVYEACRRGGAIVASAHAHIYARTHLMSRFEDPQQVVHRNRTMRVEPGRSFAFVSGLGGNSIRPATKKRLLDPWWAAHLSRGSPKAGFGALFFHIGFRGDPWEALAYFKTTKGDVIDLFHVQVAPPT